VAHQQIKLIIKQLLGLRFQAFRSGEKFAKVFCLICQAAAAKAGP